MNAMNVFVQDAPVAEPIMAALLQVNSNNQFFIWLDCLLHRSRSHGIKQGICDSAFLHCLLKLDSEFSFG